MLYIFLPSSFKYDTSYESFVSFNTAYKNTIDIGNFPIHNI